MFNNHATNDELIRLLQKFAVKDSKSPEIRQAQRQFYNYLNRELDQHARRVVNYNDSIAKIAVQEAWIKIFITAEKYDPSKSAVKTWAKMITQRCAIDELRKSYQEPETVPIDEKTEEITNLVCPLFTSDALVYSKQLKDAIKTCIEALPNKGGPNFRQAMELCLDDDLTYEDMTTILAAQSPEHANINHEQVRKWVKRAKEKMQLCLTEKLNLGSDISKDWNTK